MLVYDVTMLRDDLLLVVRAEKKACTEAVENCRAKYPDFSILYCEAVDE